MTENDGGLEEDLFPEIKQLEILRRKRGTRRASMTRLQKKLNLYKDRPLSEIRKSDLEYLKNQIKTEIEKTQDVQDQIDVLIEGNVELESHEAEERQSKEEHNDAILEECRDLCQLLLFHEQAKGLLRETELLEVPTEHIGDSSQEVKDLVSRLSNLQVQASDFSTHEELAPLFETLWKKASSIRVMIGSRPLPTLTTAPSVFSSDSPATLPMARAAPINVELPKFHGDPLQWRRFQSMFMAAIKTRAVGFSELDKKCLLSNSITPKDGKDIIANAPEKEDLSQLMDRLQRRYGRPQVVVPLLIQNLDKPQTFGFDYEGVQRIHNHIFQGYDALQPYLEDSLCAYLLYRTTMCLTPAAKEIWDNAVSKKEVKPTFKNFRTYLESRLDQLAPSNQTTSTPSTSSVTATVTSHPHTPKNKTKSASKCLACEDKHGLIRCPVFTTYDVDKRNKFVRDKRLCINCFSDAHGCKNCPSRFSCRSCGLKHHTLLHKDAPEAPNRTLSVNQQNTTPETEESPPSPTFSNTVIVHISSKGKILKARALLDSGAGMSIISRPLATSLGL